MIIRRHFLFIISFLVILIFYTFLWEPATLLKHDRIILLYNPDNSLPWVNLRNGEVTYWDKNNTISVFNHPNCIVTSDRNYLPDISQFDAVVINVGDDWKTLKMPEQRTVLQLYVAAIKPHIDLNGFDFNQFNSVLYHQGAEFTWTTGYFTLYDNITRASPKMEKFTKRLIFYINYAIWIKDKARTRMAATVITECVTPSKREKLIAELGKELDVEIYGNCDNAGKTWNHSNWFTPEFAQELDKNFKFFLVFEPHLCDEYLSDVLYKAMSLDLIPVVFGGASYANHLPAYSYIDANSFNTTKQLAKFMKELASKPYDYAEYFWWKEYFRPTWIQNYFFYHLCFKLIHLENFPHRTTHFPKFVSNVSSKCNRKPSIMF